jgi:hypothetical protein
MAGPGMQAKTAVVARKASRTSKDGMVRAPSFLVEN